MQTIKYLEHLCDESQSDGLLRLLLIESYLGVSVIHPTKSAMLQYFSQTVSHESLSHDSKYQNTIEKARLILNMTGEDLDALQTRSEDLIAAFKIQPKRESSALILH